MWEKIRLNKYKHHQTSADNIYYNNETPTKNIDFNYYNTEEFLEQMSKRYKLNVKSGTYGVGKDAIERALERARIHLKTDVIHVYRNNETPTKEIDFNYNSTEELLEQISKRYNMEKMEPWDLAQVLGMLKQGGVISNDEYWLGQSVIPVIG